MLDPKKIHMVKQKNVALTSLWIFHYDVIKLWKTRHFFLIVDQWKTKRKEEHVLSPTANRKNIAGSNLLVCSSYRSESSYHHCLWWRARDFWVKCTSFQTMLSTKCLMNAFLCCTKRSKINKWKGWMERTYFLDGEHMVSERFQNTLSNEQVFFGGCLLINPMLKVNVTWRSAMHLFSFQRTSSSKSSQCHWVAPVMDKKKMANLYL